MILIEFSRPQVSPRHFSTARTTTWLGISCRFWPRRIKNCRLGWRACSRRPGIQEAEVVLDDPRVVVAAIPRDASAEASAPEITVRHPVPVWEVDVAMGQAEGQADTEVKYIFDRLFPRKKSIQFFCVFSLFSSNIFYEYSNQMHRNTWKLKKSLIDC